MPDVDANVGDVDIAVYVDDEEIILAIQSAIISNVFSANPNFTAAHLGMQHIVVAHLAEAK